MELQLVTFEQAKALRELGFPQDNNIHTPVYDIEGEINIYYKPGVKHCCVAPTLELTNKWIREEKNIFIEIMLDLGGGYNVKYCKLPWTNTLFDNEVGFFEDYEEALSAGIDRVIEILK